MYMIRKKIAFIGIIVAAVSTIMCPFLKVVLVCNWNMYQTDENLFFITNGLLAIMLLFIFIQKTKLFNFFSKLFFVWCLLAVCAVYFKTNNYFGMSLADGVLSKTIHLRWGWIVLFGAAVVLLVSTSKIKPKTITNEESSNKQ